jgi:DNA end-binding protein Ku
MVPRTSWKGFLRLSLISVPVKAFTANNTSEEIHLNQLHKECNSRVRYQKVCPEHGELNNEQIVKGYEYAKDQYVVIEPEEIDKLRTKADRSVNIDGFIPADAIDPVFFSGRTNYLLPDGPAGERPYTLLHEGMVANKVAAIAQVVMSGREQLVLVRPMGKLLVMTAVSYAKEIKAVDDFESEVPDVTLRADEKALTNTLIGATKIEQFDLDKYQDTYVEKLRKVIDLKVEGREIVQAPDHEEPRILNLMDALKQSVAQAQGLGGTPAAGGASEVAEPGRKMAPSAGTGKRKGRGKTESG